MKKITLLVILLASVAFVLPVIAGPKGGKDVNFTAVEPVHWRLGIETDVGAYYANGDIATVPEGKQFVLEHVSAHLDGPPGEDLGGKVFYEGGEFWLVFHYQYTWGAWARFVASQPMRAYINEGAIIHYSIHRNEGSSDIAVSTVTISGYLVDLPK